MPISLARPVSDPHKTHDAAEREKLRQLTEQFRAGLQPWKDAKGNIRKIIDEGVEKPLLYTTVDEVKNYAQAYTAIWKLRPPEEKREMRHHWWIECKGLYIDWTNWGSWKKREWAPVRFDGCVIAGANRFNRHVFLDSASFTNVEFQGLADFSESTFDGDVVFDAANFQDGADFTNTIFRSTASFQLITTKRGTINFSHAFFRQAPLFHESKLPQGSSFDRAAFFTDYRELTQLEVEQETRAFRTLKQIAAGYRGQQDEAEFFALEQKARRVAFLAPHLVWYEKPWWEPKSGLQDLLRKKTWTEYRNVWKLGINPVEWMISLIYSALSGYGRSPGRAITCFIAANLIAFAIFYYFFDFGSCSDARIDYCSVSTASSSSPSSLTMQYPAAHLVIQNLLNPAGLVSEKAAISLRHPVMLFVSIAQFALSYLILFLAALAIRTRFQKGGGGDK